MNRNWKENPLVLSLLGWLVGLPLIYLWVQYFFFYGILGIAGLYVVLTVILFAWIFFEEFDPYRDLKGWRKVGLVVISTLVGILAYLSFGLVNHC